MKRLIVTADDFGASLPVNEAIEQAHRQGILTTASLMVGAAAVRDAVERAKRLPSLKVGLHVVLVRGRPLLPPDQVPDLVDTQGNFSSRLARAGVNFFFRSKVRRQLEAEIRAQYEAFRATGLVLDHVNAHNHMHLHPTVLGLILKIGPGYGAHAVRLPNEPFIYSWRAARNALTLRIANSLLLKPWITLMRWRLNKAGVACNEYLFGMSDSGRMNEQRVLGLLAHLPHGVSEMYFHPALEAWDGMDPGMAHYDHQAEFQALVSPAVARAVHQHQIEKISFGDLPAKPFS
ncbi:MAG TPA: hopanoid biosynthesis-associated protein HpnK [Burkholderiales bacterium]|nr:hopanoid biosynthesis-associated protein HpnK [Burkholderiales bacterium]